MIDLGRNDRRFWDKVKIGPGCWEWRGGLIKAGYGCFHTRVSGRWLALRAHRVAWELVYGEQPVLHVLHHCDNPACVRPSHLYLGSQSDNMYDRVNRGRDYFSGRTHCKQGHEFTPENTRFYPSSGRARQCVKCHRESRRKWRENRRIAT